MKRNIVTTVFVLVLLSSLYLGVYRSITAGTTKAMRSDHPELEWLRREYELNDDQFTRIREKHKDHDIV